MPLLKIHENSYCLDDALSIGVYLDESTKEAILIDSGIDKTKIHSIKKSIPRDYKIGAIINTHSHADHCGGNAKVQADNPAVRIFATKFEQGFIETPSHEPHGFNCLAEPFQELQNKFLCAEASRVTDIIDYSDHEIVINDKSFRIITLPGHSAGMIGVITPDNVFYCGDAAFGATTFRKHGVLFYSNITDTLASLSKMIRIVTEQLLNGFVFYHGGSESVANVSNILEQHIEKILATQSRIKEFIETQPRSIDELTGLVIREFSVPANIVQFSLTQSCVRAYLVALQRSNDIELFINEDSVMEVRARSSAFAGLCASTDEALSPCCGK